MALRNLRYFDDPILRKTSRLVAEITPRILTLLDDMAETMAEKNGVGLAAPQVGVLKRVVVIDMQDERGLVELINPEIAEKRGEQKRKEGCLSMPGKIGLVERPLYVKVKATDRNGEAFFIEGEEMMAVCLCHELDHLDGVLYTDIAEAVVDDDHDDADGEDEDEDEDESEAL